MPGIGYSALHGMNSNLKNKKKKKENPHYDWKLNDFFKTLFIRETGLVLGRVRWVGSLFWEEVSASATVHMHYVTVGGIVFYP